MQPPKYVELFKGRFNLLAAPFIIFVDLTIIPHKQSVFALEKHCQGNYLL